MKDVKFRRHNPRLDPGLEVCGRGDEVGGGYKPDMLVSTRAGKLKFILESERKTDRKALVGDLTKAWKLASDRNATATLVIVLKEWGNLTVKQIADHLQPYFTWLKNRRRAAPGLSSLIVISDIEYQRSRARKEAVGSPAFIGRGHQLG
jgi:hypothetical protein